MQKMIRKTVAPGVRLTIVPTDKFKTSVMSACLLLPLGTAHASDYAVLPRVLRRGTAHYPDMQALGGALDALYGARVEPSVRRRGEALAVGFISDVIDETYAPGGAGLTAQAAALLVSFWKQPFLMGGVFSPDYVAGERENLADRVEALKNDPRSYAVRRLYELMCADEAFGQSELGTVDGARAIRPDALYKVYAQALTGACVELFYCGAMEPAAVENAFAEAWGAREAGDYAMPSTRVLARPAGGPRTVVEEMDVRQGKLSLGFRTGITGADEAYPALMLFNAAFGGSTSSKLFMNVRERLHLCYYASSSIERQKGLLSVSSGIENTSYDAAREEILRQLSGMQQGGLSDDELESARRTVLSGLQSMQDSPAQLENFWLSQSVAGLEWGLDDLSKRIRAATRDEVIATANQVRLDTVYFLKGVAQ
ncbi:insulinase family protein [Intestinibacillus massiliensis]|nr:insulinase family protein [Intestinibacillus massiliensis]